MLNFWTARRISQDATRHIVEAEGHAHGEAVAVAVSETVLVAETGHIKMSGSDATFSV